MEETQLLCATQILDDDLVGDGDDSKKQVGLLELDDGPEYKVYLGENTIGRDPSGSIVLSQPSLSRHHAVVEAEHDGATIHDVGSSNGTKKNGIKLKKDIRYNLNDGDCITFGDVKCTWRVAEESPYQDEESLLNVSGTSVSLLCRDNEDDEAEGTLADLSSKVETPVGETSRAETNQQGQENFSNESRNESLNHSSGSENEENKPPNFVPETPFVQKKKDLIGDLSFIPESQSSPLPTSGANNLHTKVAASPMSDFNDSSFLAPSQPTINPLRKPDVLPSTNAVGEPAKSSMVCTVEDSLQGDDEEEEDIFSDPDNTTLEGKKERQTEVRDTGSFFKTADKSEDFEIYNVQTQALSKIKDGGEDQKSQSINKLSESELLCADTQDLSKMSDSRLLNLATQAVCKTSDSYLLNAETQDLHRSSGLILHKSTADITSDSLIFNAPTQALDKMSDSELMVAETQVVRKIENSEILNAETQALFGGEGGSNKDAEQEKSHVENSFKEDSKHIEEKTSLQCEEMHKDISDMETQLVYENLDISNENMKSAKFEENSLTSKDNGLQEMKKDLDGSDEQIAPNFKTNTVESHEVNSNANRNSNSVKASNFLFDGNSSEPKSNDILIEEDVDHEPNSQTLTQCIPSSGSDEENSPATLETETEPIVHDNDDHDDSDIVFMSTQEPVQRSKAFINTESCTSIVQASQNEDSQMIEDPMESSAMIDDTACDHSQNLLADLSQEEMDELQRDDDKSKDSNVTSTVQKPDESVTDDVKVPSVLEKQDSNMILMSSQEKTTGIYQNDRFMSKTNYSAIPMDQTSMVSTTIVSCQEKTEANKGIPEQEKLLEKNDLSNQSKEATDKIQLDLPRCITPNVILSSDAAQSPILGRSHCQPDSESLSLKLDSKSVTVDSPVINKSLKTSTTSTTLFDSLGLDSDEEGENKDDLSPQDGMEGQIEVEEQVEDKCEEKESSENPEKVKGEENSPLLPDTEELLAGVSSSDENSDVNTDSLESKSNAGNMSTENGGSVIKSLQQTGELKGESVKVFGNKGARTSKEFEVDSLEKIKNASICETEPESSEPRRGRRSRKSNSKYAEYEKNLENVTTENESSATPNVRNTKGTKTPVKKNNTPAPTSRRSVSQRKSSVADAGTDKASQVSESNTDGAVELGRGKRVRKPNSKFAVDKEESKSNSKVSPTKANSVGQTVGKDQDEKKSPLKKYQGNEDPEILFPGDEGNKEFSEALTQIQEPSPPSPVSRPSRKSSANRSSELKLEPITKRRTRTPSVTSTDSKLSESSRTVDDSVEEENVNIKRNRKGRMIRNTKEKEASANRIGSDKQTDIAEDANKAGNKRRGRRPKSEISKETPVKDDSLARSEEKVKLPRSRRLQSKEDANSEKNDSYVETKGDKSDGIDNESIESNPGKVTRSTRRGNLKTEPQVSSRKSQRGKNKIEVDPQSQADPEGNHLSNEKNENISNKKTAKKRLRRSSTRLKEDLPEEDIIVRSKRTKTAVVDVDSVPKEADLCLLSEQKGVNGKKDSETLATRGSRRKCIDLEQDSKQGVKRKVVSDVGETGRSSKRLKKVEEVTESEIPGESGTRSRRGKSGPVKNTEAKRSAASDLHEDKRGAHSRDSSGSSKETTRKPARVPPSTSLSSSRTDTDDEATSDGSPSLRRVSTLDSSHGSPSLRRTAVIRKKYKVMFTGYVSDKENQIVTDLGGEIVAENIQECSILVTDKIRRTAKFLCAVARGIPVVSSSWIFQSKVAGTFLDPWDYLLKDDENEKKWGFKLETTLHQASKNSLLKGLSIHVTKKVTPGQEQFKEIIESGGGTYLSSPPTKPQPNLYVLSCPEDRTVLNKLKKANVNVMDKEFILSGIIKYKLDFDLVLG